MSGPLPGRRCGPTTLLPLYRYLDRLVAELPQADAFTLYAIRDWVVATRSGRRAQIILRGRFVARHLDSALPSFLCSMTLVDQHGHGTMRFAPSHYHSVAEDEARLLALFGVARADGAGLIRIATSLVSDDMASQLAGAATQFGSALRLRT